MKKCYIIPTQIHRNPTEEGESIEEMLTRAIANNEPIDGNAPMIYTKNEDGVMPQYDIRADRQELALEATDKWSKSERAKSEGVTENSVPEPSTEGKEQ